MKDADIIATDEYIYLASKFVQIPQKYLEADAILACKLALRDLRNGGVSRVVSQAELDTYIDLAYEQRSTAQSAEGMENQKSWVPFQSRDAVTDPALLQTEFAHWLLLAGKAEPDKLGSKMNCWEMVMYAAFKAGAISEPELKNVYKKAVGNVRTGKYFSVGLTFEEVTKASDPMTYKLGDADSPRPLVGDIVVFKHAPTHAAIATGNNKVNAATGATEAEVMSLWTPNGKKIERTTLRPWPDCLRIGPYFSGPRSG